MASVLLRFIANMVDSLKCFVGCWASLSTDFRGCQAFRVYEMIILLRPYNTLYGIYYAAWRQGIWAMAVYNERARAHVAYTMPLHYVHGRMNIIPWARTLHIPMRYGGMGA